jgi:hypothetical protein
MLGARIFPKLLYVSWVGKDGDVPIFIDKKPQVVTLG